MPAPTAPAVDNRPMDDPPLLVVTTVATRADANALARSIVDERLAACAQIAAIDSVYRWQGEVHAEAEFRIVFKTAAGRYPAIEAAIRARHPYTLPAIHAVAASHAEPAYAAWVALESGAATAAADPAAGAGSSGAAPQPLKPP